MQHGVVIVGGSAGTVLAARLSEDGNRHVLLLEAGPAYQPRQFPVVTAAFLRRLHFSRPAV